MSSVETAIRALTDLYRSIVLFSAKVEKAEECRLIASKLNKNLQNEQ